ncbi:AAA family ATPase [Natranaerobius trueperi]|uniref:AAA domain-containing protein n=1 Tax=Natranaerobius trueperi TaxID=759412 RepID=A0A226BYL3_9FIRM|nr:AAA family ATPase [Natranaerobius trueperi]OWZ83424.1 hypothetical protein CDO51_08515 [Natranaerobius trueperi]
MGNLSDVQIGQELKINPVNNDIYTKTYHSQILNIGKRELRISIPYVNGRLIPLGAGTQIKVIINSETFDSEVISRELGHEKSLIIATPHSIFRGNRVNNKTKVISITSGKGGVGKSTLSINLAIAMSKLGKKVCLIDADLGMANIDVLLKMTPKMNLTHIINNEAENIFDVIVEGPEGVLIVPGSSGWQNIANLKDRQFQRLIKAFNELEQYTDIILFDTGAGINNNIINFLLASDEVLLVTTPEPHAITDAYAMIKVIMEQKKDLGVKLIVNKTSTPKEGSNVGNKISFASNKFLGVSMEYLGCVQENQSFIKSSKNQTPILQNQPNSKTAKEIKDLASSLIGEKNKPSSGMVGFIKKLTGLFKK